jgi:hypothetical protein
VGADRTVYTAGQTRWASARGERPRDSDRDLLCPFDRLQWQALPKDLPPKSTAHPTSCYGILGFETAETSRMPAENMPDAGAIPIIDLGPYLAGEPGGDRAAAELRHALTEIGF